MTAVYDPHLIGYHRIGYSRIGVFKPYFDRFISMKTTISAVRTKRIVTGEQHATTGQFNVSYGTGESIDISFIQRNRGFQTSNLGLIGQDEKLVMTADPLFMGDLLLVSGIFYDVVSPPQEYRDSLHGFIHRIAKVKRMVLAT